MSERTCGTCAHWRRPDHRENYGNAVTFANDEWDDDAELGFGGYIRGAAADLIFGECEGVAEGWDLPDGPPPLAVVRDGSDYKATLYTQAEFGCALWAEETP